MIWTDVNFWGFVLTMVIISLTLVGIAFLLSAIIKSKLKIITRIILSCAILSVVGILVLARFMAFGPGTQDIPPPADEEGINQMMDRFPDEDLQKADESADKKIPDVLKQVQDNAQEDEDEKFKKALDGALNAQ